MPPHRRNVDGIAGFELGFLRYLDGLRVARIAVEFGIRHGYKADGSPGGIQLHRADIKIRHLLGREEPEATPASDDAGDVFRIVVVRADDDTAAYPEIGVHVVRDERHGVRARKARPMLTCGRRAHVDGLRLFLGRSHQYGIEGLPEAGFPSLEVQLPEVLHIEESPFDLGRSGHHVNGRAVVKAQQVVGECGGGSASIEQRPITQ